MNESASVLIAIKSVSVNKEFVLARIALNDRGVFMVSVVSEAGDLMHKRFVQLEIGDNNLKMPVGTLQRGQYILTVLKGEQLVNRRFVH